MFSPIDLVPLDHERFCDLHCSLGDSEILCLSFDASAFNDKWSGSIDCWYRFLAGAGVGETAQGEGCFMTA